MGEISFRNSIRKKRGGDRRSSRGEGIFGRRGNWQGACTLRLDVKKQTAMSWSHFVGV